MNFPKPADPHHMRNAAGVVPIGLISLGRKRFLHMDGLDDYHDADACLVH
jgi:hypothetical protein